MFGGDGEKKFSLIGATIKTVIVVAGMSWFAANWMSTATDRQGLAHLAGRISRGEDPTTTGSIAARANQTKIDPCTVPRR
jgi:hypothetical protein